MRPPRSEGRIAPDVFARALAISLVVFNHAAVVPGRPYELGGGLSALIVLSGYAFARFTLAGNDGPRLRAGIVRYFIHFGGACLALVLLSFAVRRSFAWSELLFVHNFFGYSHIALFYNWYAESLLQSLGLIYLLSFWRPWLDAFRRQPWTVALATTVIALAIKLAIAGLWSPSNRLPHYLMWQFLFGWVIYFALQQGPRPDHRKTVTLCLAVLFSVMAFPLNQPLRIPYFIGTTALLLFASSVQVGALPARALSLVSQANLTLFLTHWAFLQLFNKAHLRRYPTGFHLGDTLFAWSVAMAGGLALWLLGSSLARAWHHMRREASGRSAEAEVPPGLDAALNRASSG